MSFHHHLHSLSRDVRDRTDCVVGRANAAVVKARVEGLRQSGEWVGSDVVDAAAQLYGYFDELCAGLGSDACELIRQQQTGEVLFHSEADQAVIDAALRRRVKTTIDRTTAKRLVEVLQSADWSGT